MSYERFDLKAIHMFSYLLTADTNVCLFIENRQMWLIITIGYKSAHQDNLYDEHSYICCFAYGDTSHTRTNFSSHIVL